MKAFLPGQIADGREDYLDWDHREREERVEVSSPHTMIPAQISIRSCYFAQGKKQKFSPSLDGKWGGRE